MKHRLLREQTLPVIGTIKNRPEDFVVEEIPLYDPCGLGEHLFIGVRKQNMTHDTLIRLVAKEFGVSNRAIGCAGRKDFLAMTSQILSIHLPNNIPDAIDGIEIVSHANHTNKLRLGHLIGNRFDIRIRDVDPTIASQLHERLQHMGERGLPNAFGPQRFGNHNNNHILGEALVKEEWDNLVNGLLGGENPHHTYALRGEYRRAFEAWPFGQPAERNVLEALAHGKTPRQACATIPKPLRQLWVNALQSAMFNSLLAFREGNNTWNTLLVGDLVWNHEGGGRTFEAKEEEIATEEMQTRLSTIAVSPSGPLWGTRMRLPTGNVLIQEQAILGEHGLSDEDVQSMKRYARGARRPLRIPVWNTGASGGIDAHGPFVRVQFDLPAGSYATVLIDRLLTVSP